MRMRKKSGLQVMIGLIGMVKPLLCYMLLAIFLGSIGHLAAIALTILGGLGLLTVMGQEVYFRLGVIIALLILCAISRGFLRYGEQLCNHYIAFKLLAHIRNRVFNAIRRLAPAKLDGNDKGNLISIITSDIELLEVFYAHTISPIAIALLTSVVMILFIAIQNVWLGILAMICYVLVGVVIPLLNGRYGRKKGQCYRTAFGELNTVCLDNLYGLDEILQYQYQNQRTEEMNTRTRKMEESGCLLKRAENLQMIVSDIVIVAAGVVAVIVSTELVHSGKMGFPQALVAVLALMSSFGPTVALSALSNNLNQTLASGDRVLSLLEEEPLVEEVTEGEECGGHAIIIKEASFSYPDSDKEILKAFSNNFKRGQISGVFGRSGCGKSTVLKLLMRFYRLNSGEIYYGENEIETIKTDCLHQEISYVGQETFLFQDTIAENICISKQGASKAEIIAAAKKASIHEFIEALPKGYETKLAELGSNLSGGERQRIGLARAFLHDGDIIYLDEPTSNIDSLNEGIILKSLLETKEEKTIILVSHRKSTMSIAEQVLVVGE